MHRMQQKKSGTSQNKLSYKENK